ncbi:hypothetical protein GOP47_0011338 [Adiantum capillus-veneris]|uniref:CUE domain-containing protein n=1 Tax=Adiantum capillus-veneris TaxID=13818 RepID=A0A9D4UT18_ADICA|nr:hypothetical protein GOP47_0011338 [Adiantum capillus-veneris]
MDCDVGTLVDLLREAFPKIDARIIKATALEHGDDVNSALAFLSSIIDDDDEQENASPDSGESVELSGSSTRELNGFIGSVTRTAAPELSNSISQISLASLEEIVEDAKNDKEIVLNLVKEVSDLRGKADLERAAVLRAKSEAATKEESLLKKADELREKVTQKKQDNFLRMGEIYGEKAVLATEARGLKLRLEQVKLQKEKAVTTLHEIKVMLQRCYEEAVEERLAAEEDGRVKEKLAQDILAAEEALMATIEEESRKLDMEAVVCLQLKEFLSHHGSIIDSLQGEMCVLCEDVESFKGQVGDGMWSSISTESLPANVNPEGPYIFRTCKMSLTSLSQGSGRSFEALNGSKHGMHASSRSQETAGNAVEQLNGVSHSNGEDLRQQLKVEEGGGWRLSLANSDSTLCNSDAVMTCNRASSLSSSSTSNERNCDWHQRLTNSESLFGDVMEAMSSPLTERSMRSDIQRTHSFVDNSTMFNKLSSPSSNRSWASSSGSSDGFTYPSNNPHTVEKLNFLSAPCAGDGWVFTPNQMEESKSSTSSSLIKVEAEDYRSD